MKKVINKSLAAFFAAVILFGSLAVGGEGFTELLDSLVIKAEAATQLNVTAQDAYNWALSNYVHPDWGDVNGNYKGECVSLVKRYIYYALGIKESSYIPSGYASGFKDAAAVKNNFDIFYSGNPKVGDIFVDYGTPGHCGIVMEVNSSNYITAEWNNWSKECVNVNGYVYYSGKRSLSDYGYLIRPKFKNSNQQPIGHVDNLSGGNGTIYVRGWAYDPDEESKSISIHVYVGGPAGSSGAERIILGNTNAYRPDVAYGGNNYHGFDTTVTTSKRGSQSVYVYAIDSQYNDNPCIGSGTVTINNPDYTKPTASISSTNNVAASQTVTLSMSDNAGLAGYFWGTNSTYTNNTYTAISGTSKSVTKTVSSNGTYYLTVKDTSGNISSTVSKVFYKTTLNANGGSVSPASVITMSGNSFTLPTSTKSGYSFTGWNTNSSGTGTNYAAGASYKPTGNVTLYAVWKANDTTKPSASISSTNNVAASQTVTLSMSDNAGLAGYYWGTNSSYSSNTYTVVNGTSKSVTKTVSSNGTYYLTVKDTAGNISSTVSKTFYKTTLNANGGSVSPTSVITMSGNSFALPTSTKSGYSFTGWNTNSSGTGTNYAVGASYKPTGNVTLYAQWTLSTYTVVFNKNGGSSGSTESQTFTYNEEAKLNKNGFHKYTGADVWYEYNGATGGENNIIFTAVYREFLGWSKSPTGPVQYKDEEIVKNLATSGTVTLYAIWSTEKTMYRLPEPTKTGYIFMGWNTKADGSGENYSAGTIYTPDEDCTLYAQWKPVNVTPTKYVCEKCGAEFTDKNEFIIHDLNHAVEDLEKWPVIHIKYSVKSRTESYGATITFTATTSYLPENSSIHWFINGRDSGTGEKYTVNKAKNSYTVQAKIIDESGVVRSESETETVNINTSFWSKIVYFFKNLFHRLPVIVQSIDE